MNTYNCTCPSHHRKGWGREGKGASAPCGSRAVRSSRACPEQASSVAQARITRAWPTLAPFGRLALQPLETPSVFWCPLLGLTGAHEQVRLRRPARAAAVPHPPAVLSGSDLGRRGRGLALWLRTPAQQGRWGEVCCLHPHAPRCTSCKCLVSLCSLRGWERKRDRPLSCGPSSPSPQPPPPAQKNHPLCKLSHAHCHRAAKARTTSSVETESRFTQVNTTCMLIAPETTANL